MKKILFLLIVVVFLAGCSAEWYEHDTIYKTNDHMWYSMGGYRNLSLKDGGVTKSPISRQSNRGELQDNFILLAERMKSFRFSP